MIKIIGIVFTGIILLTVLKQIKPEYAFLLRLALTVPAVTLLISLIDGVFNEMLGLDGLYSGYASYLKIAVKVLGICYLSQTGADICRDCGESALATQVELLGRIATVTVSVPIIKQLMEFSINLISK